MSSCTLWENTMNSKIKRCQSTRLNWESRSCFQYCTIPSVPSAGIETCRVYGLRRGVRWWYTRKLDREVQEKELLKQRLEQKLEELKEKSDYYNTQQLLERYDSKASPKSSTPDRFVDPTLPPHLQPKRSKESLRPRQSVETLRQRGSSKLPLPPLPPPINPATFQLAPPPQPQNSPQFHPSAFSPPPSPTLAPQHQSKTFLDRVLDLLVGEDENAADHRYALICRHCRAHNGLAPPGERGDQVGYLCGRCGGWNGPDPNKPKSTTPAPEEKEKKSVSEEKSDDVSAGKEEQGSTIETENAG